MWIQLCELLVIVILLAMLSSRSKSGPSRGSGFSGEGYREGVHSQLQATRTRVQDLERTIASLRSQARQRNRIIWHLWRRNAMELVLRIAWNAYTGFWRILMRIPWPGPYARGAIMFPAIAGAVLWGVIGMIPQHHGPPAHRPFTHHRIREPTMIPIQVTWGGEVAIEPVMDWQCRSPEAVFRITSLDHRTTVACQVLTDLDCPALYEIPPFFLKEDDWVEWIYLVQYQTETPVITITLD